MKVEFSYPRHYDLIFHVLAHFKVNNASNLYDADYIAKMNRIEDVNALENYYNNNFDRLMLINFLPYYCADFEDMKNNFLTCNRFTQEDIKLFIKPFIEMLDNEAEFFFHHWDSLDEGHNPLKAITEKGITKRLEKYACVFDYFRKQCKVLFSYVIANNGRGFYSDTHFAALIRFPEAPENESELDFAFIQLLHEYTHSFTDQMLRGNINMADGSHHLSENLVIVADYLLIKLMDAEFIPRYFEWLSIDANLRESEFFTQFNIGEDLMKELTALINNFAPKVTI